MTKRQDQNIINLRNTLGKNNMPDGFKGLGDKNHLKECFIQFNTQIPILISEISSKKSLGIS